MNCLACFAQNSSQGSLIDKTQRIEMDNPVFAKLQRAILHPSRSKEWFGMVEQIINAVYALAEHPDVFCNDLIRKLSTRVFNRPKTAPNEQPDDVEKQSADLDAEASDNPGDMTMHEGDVMMLDPTQPSQAALDDKGGEKDTGDAFELSQLLFIVGHVAIKHIVFLELVEREWKRQKDEKQAGKSLSLLLLMHYLMSVKAEKKSNGNQKNAKEVDELEQVAGNAGDEVGDRIAAVRETELLYGPTSLLAVYGPMLVHICGSPHKFKV